MYNLRTILIGGGLTAAALVGGGVGASMVNGVAGAQTASTATTAPATTAPATAAPRHDPSQGGHQANGRTETLLTGDQADKARTAALEAVPGATIERVETDADGEAYEAHVVKSDGSHATVLFDQDFKVVRVDAGPGAR
jgi:hypothetical protein